MDKHAAEYAAEECGEEAGQGGGGFRFFDGFAGEFHIQTLHIDRCFGPEKASRMPGCIALIVSGLMVGRFPKIGWGCQFGRGGCRGWRVAKILRVCFRVSS